MAFALTGGEPLAHNQRGVAPLHGADDARLRRPSAGEANRPALLRDTICVQDSAIHRTARSTSFREKPAQVLISIRSLHGALYALKLLLDRVNNAFRDN
jgi:hypothetical protein